MAYRTCVMINIVVFTWISLVGCGASSVNTSQIFLNATETTQHFQSPGYPTAYQTNQQIRWIIRSTEGSKILFTILEGSIESCCDYLEVRDNATELLGKFTGSNLSGKSRISTYNYLEVLLSSDQTIVKNGFRASYKTANCGANLEATKLSQMFSTPGWPQGYNVSTDCYWIIYSNNEQVQVDMKRGETERRYDYVEVSDGLSRRHTISGKVEEQTFSSTMGQLLVHFRSDIYINKRGVLMEYHLAFCEYSLVANESTQTISTPLYPSVYPNNADCNWNISAKTEKRVFVQFLQGNTERCCDKIQIKNPQTVVQTISGDIPPGTSFISSEQRLLISFKSDNTDGGPGFQASYTEADCGSNFEVTNTTQTFSYARDGNKCFWILNGRNNKQVQLKLSGRLEGGGFIEVFDGMKKLGRRSGNILQEIFISSHGFLIVSYDGNENSENDLLFGEYKENCGSVISVSSTPTIIRSSSSPSSPSNDCTWRFVAPALRQITLMIISASLQRCCDTLQVYSGQTVIRTFQHDVNNLLISSESNSLSLSLSGNIMSKETFEISAKLANCGKRLVAGAFPSVVTSPGWPNAYGNDFRCEWLIEAAVTGIVNLELEEVDLEECCDFVTVFEGTRKLGNFSQISQRRSYQSSKGGSLKIVFVSDPAEVGKGFRAKYFLTEMCDPHVEVNSMENRDFNLIQLNLNKDFDCETTFEADEGFQTFLSLNTSANRRGYAKIFEGNNFLSILRNNSNKGVFVSRNRRLNLVVHFPANSNFSISGVYRQFSCNENITVGTAPRSLSLDALSLNSLYLNNLDCSWRLTAPSEMRVYVIIERLDIESCCDVLQLKLSEQSKPIALTGTLSQPKAYISTGNVCTILFRSDQSIRKEGFLLQYNQIHEE